MQTNIRYSATMSSLGVRGWGGGGGNPPVNLRMSWDAWDCSWHYVSVDIWASTAKSNLTLPLLNIAAVCLQRDTYNPTSITIGAEGAI